MVKVLINLISILLSVISSKLVYCYTAMVGFTVMLLNVVFPSFSKKYNQQSISLDHDELENLQKQISSSFTKAQSIDTFPVSVDSSFNSHVALDVIESQNQRYQDYIKFKVQMKKKQNKTISSTTKQSSTESNIIDNQFLSVPKPYFNESADAESQNVYAGLQEEQAFEAAANDNTSSSNYNSIFESQCSNICCYDNNNIACSSDNENLLEASSCAANTQDLECDAQGAKKSVHQRNPLKNYTSYYLTNLNRKYNNKLNTQVKCENNAENDDSSQEFQEEDISTEDSSAANSEDEDESSTQILNDVQEEDHDDLQELNNYHSSQQMDQPVLQRMDRLQGMPIKQAPFQPNMSSRCSSDYNIELLNQQVIKDQLHNYFNMSFLQIKKVKLDHNFNIHDQLENFCSKKRCPCLKFKRRFQRVRSVHSNKKKLPTILENFAY